MPAAGALPSPAEWCRMWSALGADGCDEALRDRLIARYGEPSRHYHTTQHVGELFALWPLLRSGAAHPAEVEAALWFHDAVYDASRGDNEERSASLARSAMQEAGVPHHVTERVESLILATRHDAVPEAQDERIVADLDLSILGAPAERFDEYERQVREEYAFVPRVLFRRARSKVLAGFLERPRIYMTDALHDRLEASARANIRRSPYAPS